MTEREPYLGDAVFASHDGWQICLRSDDGNNQVIYLEPAVLPLACRVREAHRHGSTGAA